MAVPLDNQRQKPGIAVVERARGERPTVKPRPRVLRTEDSQCKLVAKPSGHGKTRAAIAHGVVNTVMNANMRQMVEGIRHEAHPRVGDLDVPYLREDSAHYGMEARTGHHGIGLAGCDAAAEDEARKAKRGLWAGEFVRPAEWRDGKR